jgi:hypothetical protein
MLTKAKLWKTLTLTILLWMFRWLVFLESAAGEFLGKSALPHTWLLVNTRIVFSGLFHCTIRELWSRERWEVTTRKLVDVTEPLDAPVAEYLLSELGQTYWYQGGLKPYLAGTMMMSGKRALTSPDYDNLWYEAKLIVTRLNFAHLNMAHYKKVLADNQRIMDEKKSGLLDRKWDKIQKAKSLLKATLDRIEERTYAYVLTCHIEAIDDWVRKNDEYQKAKAAENGAEASADT